MIRWNRPAGWLLLLWPTLSGLWLAAGGFPGWHLLGVFVLGTILMRSAGCCVNDVADRDFDRHVKRTAQRPITSGRLSVREATAVGVVLALVSFVLVLFTNRLTIALSFGALGVAILDYARSINLGISSFVSIGNKADVSSNDLLQYWEDDPLTSVVLLYLESFGNPAKFSRIARRIKQELAARRAKGEQDLQDRLARAIDRMDASVFHPCPSVANFPLAVG